MLDFVNIGFRFFGFHFLPEQNNTKKALESRLVSRSVSSFLVLEFKNLILILETFVLRHQFINLARKNVLTRDAPCAQEDS